jgi:hypothetical protein
VSYSVTDANNNTVTAYQVVVINDGSYMVDKDYIIYAQDFSIKSKDVVVDTTAQILTKSYAKAWESLTGKAAAVTVTSQGGYSATDAVYSISIAVADKTSVKRSITATVSSEPVVPVEPEQPTEPTQPVQPIQPTQPTGPAPVAPVVIYQPMPVPAEAASVAEAEADLEVKPAPEAKTIEGLDPALAQLENDGTSKLGFLVHHNSWALINMLIVLAIALIAVVQWLWFTGVWQRTKNEDSAKRPAGIIVIPLFAALIAVLSIAVFAITSELDKAMVIVDSNTWFMVLLILVQLIILGLAIAIGTKVKARKSSVILDFGGTR